MAERSLAARSEEQAVLDTMSALWPGDRPRVLTGTAARAGRGYLVLPSMAMPRLMVPQWSRGAAAVAMSDFSEATSRKQTVLRLAAATSLRLGLVRGKPVVEVEPQDSIVEHLSDILDEPVVVSVGIGTPRANRKPVLRIINARNRLIGFAKVGTNELVDALIAREHESLMALPEDGWTVLRPPKVLHYGDWGGHSLLVMSALPSRARFWKGARTQVPVDVAREIGSCLGTSREVLGTSRFMQSLQSQAASLPVSRLGAALYRLGSAGQTLTFGSWHGDFTPWNMASVRRDGKISVWDWEQFQTGVPLGMDEIHFRVNVDTTAQGFTASTLRHSLASLRGQDGDAPGEILQLCYVAAIATRYVLAAMEPGGEAIADKARLMVELLDEMVERQ